jgi:hypothetical protein
MIDSTEPKAKLMTFDEVAGFLRMSEEKLEDYMSMGVGPSWYDVGDEQLFCPRDVEEWLLESKISRLSAKKRRAFANLVEVKDDILGLVDELIEKYGGDMSSASWPFMNKCHRIKSAIESDSY